MFFSLKTRMHVIGATRSGDKMQTPQYRSPSTSPPTQRVLDQQTSYDLLNNLSVSDAKALMSVMENNMGSGPANVIFPSNWSTITENTLLTLKNAVNSERTGEWYKDRLTCRVIEGVNPQVNGHLRWQFRVRESLQNRNTVMKQINSNLSPAGSEAFRTIPRWYTFMKVQTHHIGYLAKDDRSLGLTTAIGRGSSIDHLCGNKGCHRPEHLAFAESHLTNMNRINCAGVCLYVQDNEIVDERPCPHAEAISHGGNRDELILNSCTKITVFRVEDHTEAVVTGNWQAKTSAILRASSFSSN
jgi:hypothetical protein